MGASTFVTSTMWALDMKMTAGHLVRNLHLLCTTRIWYRAQDDNPRLIHDYKSKKSLLQWIVISPSFRELA